MLSFRQIHISNLQGTQLLVREEIELYTVSCYPKVFFFAVIILVK